MSTRQAFVVIEIGWEYNDEIYHTGNYGETGGSPTKVFLDRKNAENFCLKNNIAELRGKCEGAKENYAPSLCEYGYDYDSVVESGKEKQLMDLIGIKEANEDDFSETCKKCKSKIVGEGKFCSNCGTNVENKQARKRPRVKSIEEWWNDGATMPENLSDETLEKILDCLKIAWYKVEEVELEG